MATTLLYAVIAILIATNYAELKWAGSRLPGYFEGRIPGSTRDRQLLRRAHDALVKDRQPEKGLQFLDELLRMDTASADGYLLLGQSHYAMNHLAEAEAAFLRAMELDPTLVEAYMNLSEIFLQQGQHDKARTILLQGRDYFQNNVAYYQPVLDSSVPDKFNNKATRIYLDYQKKLLMMQAMLQRLSPALTPEP